MCALALHFVSEVVYMLELQDRSFSFEAAVKYGGFLVLDHNSSSQVVFKLQAAKAGLVSQPNMSL
jgi:hypothetical protein